MTAEYTEIQDIEDEIDERLRQHDERLRQAGTIPVKNYASSLTNTPLSMWGSEKIAQALAQAQAEMPSPKLDAVNPHFKTRYATLKSVLEAAIPALTRAKIAISHQTTGEPGFFFLRTTLCHYESGQMISTDFPLPFTPDKPQAIGSAMSYAKRYNILALTSMGGDLDDDGEAATDRRGNAPKVGQVVPDEPAVERASEALIEELIGLIDQSRDPQATAQTILHKAGVENFADIAPNKAADFVRVLKAKAKDAAFKRAEEVAEIAKEKIEAARKGTK